jgi:hypothetical protein
MSEIDRQRGDFSKKVSVERSRNDLLEKQCQEVRGELERKKFELVNMISERDRVINQLKREYDNSLVMQ